MAKQLNVSLAFTANTNEAIALIKNLLRELNGLATGSALKNSGITQITPELLRAMAAAGELLAKLESATNLKTGKLDLGLFNQSLKLGGKNLEQYARELKALGPAGKLAFTNLAQSIILAEAPLIRCNERLKLFGTTIANTARWQVSSSILNRFMGTLLSAFGYAQDLNESLNNIRIVTGQSVEEMATFAKEANKAAKALSTTTTAYTDASLIYYQQGLSKKEVQERADITIKMANVTRLSATEVSDQLTAIWNNFYDGTESLEYYADILTKLGAATASSTDEIAGGLEKFAAVAETIGLSYEYAAAALATITSNTRQSEEVVGTALKTIFARIQGLSLGETLDDGVTLNKYSLALDSVGISIFEQNGQLKEMDDILDEMGRKWDALSKNQLVALAQTVAGTRQYNQLVALMDNWNADDADSMKSNLETVAESSGSLTELAEIYGESWEAARNLVRAAAEDLYNKLIDDEFFVDFLKGLSKAIDGVGSLVDAFGGLLGTLLFIGSLVTKIFQQEMAQGLRNAATSMSLVFTGNKVVSQTKQNAVNALKTFELTGNSAEVLAENNALKHEIELLEKLLSISKSTTAEELKAFQVHADSVRAMDKRASAAAKVAEEEKKALENLLLENKLQAKFEAQRLGKILASSAWDRSKEGNGSILHILNQAKNQARLTVSASHNLEYGVGKRLEDRDSSYLEEVQLEFVKQLKSQIATLGDNDSRKKELLDYLNDKLEQVINESIVAEQVRKELGGRLTALGFHLSDMSGVFKGELGSIIENKKTAGESYAGSSLAIADAEKLKSILKLLGDLISDTIAKLNDLADGAEKDELLKELGEINSALQKTDLAADEALQSVERLNKVGDQIAEAGVNHAGVGFKDSEFSQAVTTERARLDYERKKEDANNRQDLFVKDIDNRVKLSTRDWANAISTTTTLVMGLGSTISSVQSAIDTFNNPDATGWLKFSAVLSVITTTLPVASTLMTTFGTAGAAAGAATATAFLPVIGIMAGIAVAVGLAVLVFKEILANINATAIAAEKAAEEAKRLTESYEELTRASEEFKASQEGYDSAVDALKDLTKGTEEYNEALEKANAEARKLIELYGLYDDYDMVNGRIVIDLKVLDTKQSELDRRAELAEGVMYAAKIRELETALALKLKQAATALGTKLTTGPLVSASGQGYIASGVTTPVVEITSKDAERLAKSINEHREKNGGLDPSLEQFTDYLRGLEDEVTSTGESFNLIADNLTDTLLAALTLLADSMNKASEATNYFAEQIIKSKVEEVWGDKARQWATNANGEFDLAKYNLLIALFTKNAVLNDTELLAQISALKVNTVGSIDNFEKILGETDPQILEEVLGLAGFDGSFDGNSEAIVEAYARYKGWQGNITANKEQGSKDRVDSRWTIGSTVEGEGISTAISLDSMLSEMLTAIKEAILVNNWTGTEEQTKVNNAVGKIVDNAADVSKKYGADFGSVILNSITNGTKLDLTSLFGDLDPAEVEELRSLNAAQLLELFKITPSDLAQGDFKRFYKDFTESLTLYSTEAYNEAQNLKGEQQAESFGLNVDEFKAYRLLLLDTNDELEHDYELLNKLAIKYQRAKDAVEALSGKMGEYNSIMLATNPNIADLAKVIGDNREALINLLNITPEEYDSLSADFFVENWGLILDAVESVEGALNNLLAKSYLARVAVVEDEHNKEVLEGLHNKIANLDLKIKLGIEIDEKDLMASAAQIIAAAGFTKDAAREYFDAWGYDIEFSELYDKEMSLLTAQDVKIGYLISSITKRKDEDSDYVLGGGTTTKKQKPEKIDRYHTINKQRDQLSRTMDLIAAGQQELYGEKLVDSILLEIDALDRLIDKNEEYQEAVKDNLALDRLAVEAMSFIVDEQGIIINYEEIMLAAINEYNNAIATNQTTRADELQEHIEQLREVVELYEETAELLDEAVDLAAEDARKHAALELKKITTAVEFNIEINQRDLNKLEYIVDKLNRTPHQMIEVIDKLGSQADAYMQQAQIYRDGIASILANAAGRELTAEERRLIMAYEDALLEINVALADLVKTIEDTLLEEFLSLSEEIEENINRFETFNSILGHYRNIIKLSGRETRDSMLLMLLSAQLVDTAMKLLNSTNDLYLAQLSALTDAQGKLAEAIASGNQADIDFWTTLVEEITKSVEDAHAAMLASWEAVLLAAAELYDAAVEASIQKFKDGISEFGLEGLSDRYDKATADKDLFLSLLTEEYELSKLIRDVEKSIDETDNITGKLNLNKILDEANKKRADGTKMSKYELEYMQKQYEVEMARLALEEARNAKSTVRLKRDAEGNFGYVYTADLDKIDEAELNYEDKLYEQQKLTEDYLDEMSKAIIENTEMMVEEIKKIDRTRFETEEEYLAEVNRITEYYLGRDAMLRDQMNIAIVNSGLTYQETILGQIEGSESMEAAQTKLKDNTATMVSEMGAAWVTWSTTVSQAMINAGTSEQMFTTTVTSDMLQIGNATNQLATTIDTQTSNMVTYFGRLVDAVLNWRDEYIKAIEETSAANEGFVGINDNLTYDKNRDYSTEMFQTNDALEAKALSDAREAKIIGEGTKVGLATNDRVWELWQKSTPAQRAEYANIDLTKLTAEWWYEKLGHYDTGGYTGAWGPEGKLAVLHEKELVLNAADTENLLSTISILREMASAIDNLAYLASMFSMSAAAGVPSSYETLEQTVTIHAEFPNATNHNEIEEAFKNLVNTASLYANRKI